MKRAVLVSPPASLSDFAPLVATWPEPVVLTDLSGNDFVTLRQHAHYTEAHWAGHITADEVVTAAKVFLALQQKLPAAGLLNDKSDVTGDWQEANDWLEFEWLPQVTNLGLKCLAHVYSDNMFSRLSARNLLERVSPFIHMHNFNNRAQALYWLQQCLPTDGQAPKHGK